jgi:hypothetical protein
VVPSSAVISHACSAGGAAAGRPAVMAVSWRSRALASAPGGSGITADSPVRVPAGTETGTSAPPPAMPGPSTRTVITVSPVTSISARTT